MMTKVTVKVCGDCHELRYNAERNRMEGITLLGPSDVRRLLEALAEAYGKGKSKRAKAISEGASQLASLIDQEVVDVFLETFVSQGNAIHLTNPQNLIERLDPDSPLIEKKKAPYGVETVYL